jgi:hypothetical protein
MPVRTTQLEGKLIKTRMQMMPISICDEREWQCVIPENWKGELACPKKYKEEFEDRNP